MFASKQLGVMWMNWKDSLFNTAVPTRDTCQFWWTITVFLFSVTKSYCLMFTSMYAWHHLESADKALVDTVLAALNMAMTYVLCSQYFRNWVVTNKWKLAILGALVDGPTEWLLIVSPFTTWMFNAFSCAFIFSTWRIQGQVRKTAIWPGVQERADIELHIDRAAYCGVMLGCMTAYFLPATNIVLVIAASGCLEIITYFTSTWRFEIADRYIKQNGLKITK